MSALALTGTPGVGKSSVAAWLASRWRVVEVGTLASGLGTARWIPRGLEVDLSTLCRRLRATSGLGDYDLVVGHLAHLLPLRDVVLLRCHPLELERRLRRARRGTADDRRENAAAEATDVVLAEARALRRRIWEVDTTDRTIPQVARRVDRILRLRRAPSFGRVSWLSDPAVTEHLLERSP